MERKRNGSNTDYPIKNKYFGEKEIQRIPGTVVPTFLNIEQIVEASVLLFIHS